MESNFRSKTMTVAIPTYFGGRHLTEALRGVLDQHCQSFDLLICDDRSEDETLDIARREAGDRVRIEINSERLGLAGNWSQCAKLAQTPWVMIFHQDDVMRPGCLNERLTAIQENRSLGMVCGAANAIDDQGRALAESVVERGGLGPVDHFYAPGELLRELAWINPLRCSTIALRVEALTTSGGFDSKLRYVTDWDCWIRISRDWPVQWLANPTVAFRWHSASETHRFKTGTVDLEETQALLDRLFESEGTLWPDAEELRQSGRRRLARAYLNRAYEATRTSQGNLVRKSLRKAFALDRRVVWRTIASDPRLAAKLAWGGLRFKP